MLPPRFDILTNNLYCLAVDTFAVKKIGVSLKTNELSSLVSFRGRDQGTHFWKFSLATVTNDSIIVTVP